jgi:hypothetical protein
LASKSSTENVLEPDSPVLTIARFVRFRASWRRPGSQAAEVGSRGLGMAG